MYYKAIWEIYCSPFLFFYLFLFYVYAYFVYALHAWCWGVLEEGVGSPRIGDPNDMTCSVGAGNQTQVFYMSNNCSLWLSHCWTSLKFIYLFIWEKYGLSQNTFKSQRTTCRSLFSFHYAILRTELRLSRLEVNTFTCWAIVPARDSRSRDKVNLPMIRQLVRVVTLSAHTSNHP